MKNDIKIQEELLTTLNQLFQIEQKVAKLAEPNSIQRNIDRIKEQFVILGLKIDNPMGEKYDETRTDCEASIAGDSTDDLLITEVLKPIIRICQNNVSLIVQRAVVIVQSKTITNKTEEK